MSKLTLFVILCLAVSVWSIDLDRYEHVEISEEDISELFAAYIMHMAPVPLEPTLTRFNYFKSKVLGIIAHNKNPNKTYTKAITKFTGLTIQEKRGLSIMDPQNCSATNGISASGLVNAPVDFDWRTVGVVSKVKDQGNCGSCWTFSTTGAIEANWAIINKKKSPLFSEQQLVDCAGDFNNFGCDGGLPSQAFEYIKHVGGIETEDSYPYKAKDKKCVFDKSKIAASVPYGSLNITAGDEKALLETVLLKGPVSIAFEVTDDFDDYRKGIYVDTTCKQGPQDVNHAVLAVGFGYDTKTKLDYWIVKNSWGKGWGEDGYFRIKRGVNMCGLAVCASYPQINPPKTTSFRV